MGTSSSLSVPDAGITLKQGRRVDWGRIVMVPVSVLFGGLAVLQVWALLRGEGGAPNVSAALAAVVTGVLVSAFYALLIGCYLRRGPARATTRVLLALLAAPVATLLPFTLPFVGTGSSPGLLVVVGDLFLIAGFGFSLWSLRCLDRSLSVIPQARALVQHGPYSRIRHPLYLGELVAMLGLALTLGGAGPLLLWVALAGLQAYRAVQEEGLLAAVLPDYANYQARTARILPGVF